MSDVKLPNLPAMSAGEMVEKLSDLYCNAIRKDYPLRKMPALMLWGPPGIGKSQAVRQIGREIEEKTGKRVRVTEVRLLLFNPIDLRGIPTANADKTLAVWLKPQIFQMDADPSLIHLLFLDELSAAPQSVQAAAYQLILDRCIGEHRLPENCIVLAAGNRVTDKSVAFKMPKALANRFLHIEITENFRAWKEWAIRNGIHEKILGFLSFRPHALMEFDSGSDDLAFATPRSWEMVSNLLHCTKGNIEEMYPLIAGIIGSGAATEFRTWAEVYQDLPNIEDIFSGKEEKIPSGTDALYALISSMVSYAKNHKDDLAGIANSIRYAEKLPPDFSAVLLKDYLYIDKDYKQNLMKLPEFLRWCQTKGQWMNGIV